MMGTSAERVNSNFPKTGDRDRLGTRQKHTHHYLWATLGSRGYFFLIDTDRSTVYFILGILRKDLWSQGTYGSALTDKIGTVFERILTNIRATRGYIGVT